MIDRDNYIDLEDYSRRPDDVTPEEMKAEEQKDGELSHLPRKTLIPEFDTVEIEASTADLINFMSALILTVQDDIFTYTASREKNPERAEFCLSKALTLMELTEPFAKKFLELTE